MTLPDGSEVKTRLAAKKLLQFAHVSAMPVDVGNLAAAQRVSVEPAKFIGDGRLLTCPRVRIEVNHYQSEVRRRFTICHELGHTFFLSQAKSDSFDLRVNAGVRGLSFEAEERLCNLAAAELLLPDELFLSRLEQHSPGFLSVIDLAEAFRVSRVSVLLRLLELKPESWPCAIIRWRPISLQGPFPKFLAEQVTEIGGFSQSMFRKGVIAGFNGLCKTITTSLHSADHVGPLRIESAGFGSNHHIKNVWSVAVESAADVRRH